VPYDAGVAGIRRVAPLACGLGLLVLIAFPFGSLQDHAHWERVRWRPFSPPYKVTDIVGNFLIGMPAGAAVAALGGTPVSAALVLGSVSLLCEWAQVYSHGRYPSATDLALNTMGGAAGAAWFTARRRRALAR
jgi:VanZ family protein